MPNHHHHHHQQQQLQEEEEEEENYPTFRWFDLLLSLVAGVVAVLAMAVLVEAVMVMRAQQYQLEIMVVHGAVLVELRPQPPMTLNFHFVASNPITNRPSKVSFTNIEISVKDRNTSMHKHFRVDDYIVGLKPGNTTVVLWSQTSDNPKVDVGSYFFEKLKKNENTLINLRLQGTLTTEFFPFNGAGDGPTFPKTATAIYSCDDVVLGVDSYLSNTRNVPCSYINS